MKCSLTILCAVLLSGIRISESRMDVEQNLIPLLNFSKTLIQDAEVTFLRYERFPQPPEEVGAIQRKILAFREQELREVHKASNPKELRKAILKSIEREKTWGGFRDSDDNFFFEEIHLVFQVHPDPTQGKNRINYRMERIDQFENHPDLGYQRYFNGGGHQFLFVKDGEGLEGHLPSQFANDNRIGAVSSGDLEHRGWASQFPCRFPPYFIDETDADIEVSPADSTDIYVITHFPFEKVMAKIYVRCGDDFAVIREELYYQSPSPNANEAGYWLRTVAEYSQFETLETLSLAHPRVGIEKEYRRADGFLRRITVITIQDMAFNQGLPPDFFDWDLQEYRTPSEE